MKDQHDVIFSIHMCNNCMYNLMEQLGFNYLSADSAQMLSQVEDRCCEPLLTADLIYCMGVSLIKLLIDFACETDIGTLLICGLVSRAPSSFRNPNVMTHSAVLTTHSGVFVFKYATK